MPQSPTDVVCIYADVTAPPLAIMPGSFNPLHQGHLELAAVAAIRLGCPVAFELSIANVDKAELSEEEVARRVEQFNGYRAIWITRAATFREKAILFPNTAFVLGFDTACRLIDPKYYGGDAGLRDEALRTIASCGCRIVVGGRVDANGEFRTWTGDGLAGKFRNLFVSLAEADFRVDVSSTELRSRARRVSEG